MIDDDEDLRDALVEQLSIIEEFEVLEAGNAQGAIDLTKENDFDLPLPKLVKEAINEYKSDHNIYETFKKDCLVKSSSERLASSDAFDAFKEHAEQCNQKIRNINRNTFITEMSRVLGKLKSNKFWKDWKIIENYGDDDENENEPEESDSDDS